MKFIIPAAALFALTSAAVIPHTRDVPSLVELDKADPEAFKFFVRSDVKDEAEVLSARSSEEQPTPTADELVVRGRTDPITGAPSPVTVPQPVTPLEDRATPTEDELVVRAVTDPITGAPSPVTVPQPVTPLEDRATPTEDELVVRAVTDPITGAPSPVTVPQAKENGVKRRGTPVESAVKRQASNLFMSTDPLPPPKKNGVKRRGTPVESAEKREESGFGTPESIPKRSLTDNADLEEVMNLLNRRGVSKRQPEGGDKLLKLPPPVVERAVGASVGEAAEMPSYSGQKRSSSNADSGPNEASLVARNKAAEKLVGATIPRPKLTSKKNSTGRI
ncbi:hypothetical protein HYALB_00010444 [Hymenoscyphus albidus]|uniref:Uncharacterized protein n=1 Tax=Hymenoscyphus albidus TaxID=595503 RepID=A0A9N9Q513_9HELO|nr:hypothetical protein HYALB_00010444 [Hymenoscyphus albidus]